MLRNLLILAGIASLLGGAWAWLMAFAAGMSDSPSDMAPSSLWLYGLPSLSVALFVAAWWVGG